jgi:hypothetical protein
MSLNKEKHFDSDEHKGAVEEETSLPGQEKHPNLSGQLGHRDQDEMLKDADSDFPEPGSNPEHSGQDR